MADEKKPTPHPNESPNVTMRGIVPEMERSYLEYAMSVIVSRALPDVRDGLKPVHRRILWAMWDMGLRSSAKFRKSATVVGEVLGKFHPHGDVAVYDSMVRMAQNFSMRYPLVQGQGNFGSIDGDNAAAMRYTEARMTALAEELLFDIEKETVAWVDNYDATRKEPAVLPGKLPNLLLNGTLGIAVGMATNIPPHNLGEVLDATVHLIDNPTASVEDLMQFIQGPDFPTGGVIYGKAEIVSAYATGRGRITMRGKAEITEDSKGNFKIIISELPYQVNKSDLVLKIADLVKDKKIQGVTDLRDESDRKDPVRVVIDLKGSAYPKKVLNALYELTPLSGAFHMNMVTLVDGRQPRLLNLKSVLEEHIKHRTVVVRARAEYELKVAKDRAHILEGLTKALNQIDEVIETIKKSRSREDAHRALMKAFALSDRQVTAILDMRLATLAALEREKIQAEYDEILKAIARLEALLGDPKKILTLIKKEFSDLKNKFADPRRTTVVAAALKGFTTEDLIPNEEVIVTLTQGGYLKRQPVSGYRAQERGGVGVTGMTPKEEDILLDVVGANTHDQMWFFTDRGRLFVANVYDIPTASRQAKGIAVQNLIQLAPDERVTATIPLRRGENLTQSYVLFVTSRGMIKKTLISLYQNVRKTGIIAITLRAKDQLLWARVVRTGDEIFIATAKGQAILFNETEVRPMGRGAEGVRAIKLRSDDLAIGVDVIAKDQLTKDTDVLVVLEKGLGKRTRLSNFRNQHRGGVGIRVAKVTGKTGPLIAMHVSAGDEGDLLMLSVKGTMIRLPLKRVRRIGRDTQGVILMRLREGDRVASATLVKTQPDVLPSPPSEEQAQKKA